METILEDRIKKDTSTLIMLDFIPLCCCIWNREHCMIDCNTETIHVFGITDKSTFMNDFFSYSPKYQPDGRLSSEKFSERLNTAFHLKRIKFEWMYQNQDGELIPAEVIFVQAKQKENSIVLGFIRDLRELKTAAAMLTQLEKLAFADELTGCYNRRYFIETARKAFSDFERTQKPISIIMMDIDKFKNVNDTYGHSFGDRVLKEIALVVKTILKPYDLFARYGGEEFIILIMNRDKESAINLAWQICDLIKNKKVICKEISITNTVSLGVADKTRTNQTLEEVIKRADMALYQAKNNGRNRVEAYEE